MKMIFTFLFRICALLRICEIDNMEELYPDTSDLNSFSSKTAYRNSKLIELKDSSKYLSKCNLIQINTIFRHGTRFPSAKDMDNMGIVHKKIMRSHAKTILPTAFQEWKLPFIKSKEKELASVGYEEMMILGKKFRTIFDTILHDKDITKHVKVFSSSLTRAKNSATTFLRTFFNESKTLKEITNLVIDNDDYLRFFTKCPHYTSTVLNNKASKTESHQFKNGPEMKRLIKDVQQRWKLTDITLTPDDLRVLYIMCGYEIATNLSSFMRPHMCPVSPAGDGLVVCPNHEKTSSKESSPLCSLLDSNQYKVLEYIYDLKHYWIKSYGREINWLQGCALMSPLMEYIIEAARAHQTAYRKVKTSNIPLNTLLDYQPYSRAVFWFGHAETLLPVITLLGLFNQSTPVTSKTFSQRLSLINNYNQRFSAFRSSYFVPFSGNLDLELHHCPHLAKDGLSGYRVQVKVNEKAVAWPLANGHSHASIELFMKHLHLCQADKYDHNAICVRGLSATKLNDVHKRSDEL